MRETDEGDIVEPGPGCPPIACSLGPADVQARLAEWQELLDDVTERQGTAGGLRLTFGRQAPVTEIARLAAAENSCCPFFAFTLTIDWRGVALEVSAPAEGQVVLQEFFGEAA